MSYQPPSGGYGPPSGGYGPPPGGYGGPAQPPPSGPPKNYMVHNILGIFGCTIIGVIGLIFSLQVNSKWQAGDYHGAEESAKVAKIMGIISLIGFILMIVVVVFYIILMVIGFAMIGTADYSTY
ncbi:CD225/dispanin family protein [Nocardiopsis flavescens]|uniref:Interferon-induced transmembrane protein n=1 Tax=Nocardiopsis flavescens TaxID=758803 RepID=A0A1M6HUA8_9ACTN|nr:CD225/dispanin family protein [Nocardiopsis flavescens]SHJ25698.1 Interferon-induced transmembrane protein [Nocardiopsis flavescens]